MKNQLIQALSAHSTPTLSDALDALGINAALPGLKPLLGTCKITGEAYTVQYQPYPEKPTEFQPAGDYIDEIGKGAVVVVDNQGRSDCTVWGAILTQTAQKKGIQATVVNGAVRDVALIQSLDYPVFCKAISMRSGKNRVFKAAVGVALCIDTVSIFPKDIICGDAHGIVCIPKSKALEVLKKAEAILETERKITEAVLAGMPLSLARKKFSYYKPWGITR